MVVENHEINEQKNTDAEITITGRSFETILDQRVVGANKSFPVSGTPVDYQLSAGNTWDQVKSLIDHHILATFVTANPGDVIPNVSIVSTVPGAGTAIVRNLKRGSLYTRSLELMEIDNLGFRSLRPGPWVPAGGALATDVILEIHKGVDRTKSVIFSYAAGEIDQARYLWTNKKLKNAALCVGKWVETVYLPAATGIDRRSIFIDCSDIDQYDTSAPSGARLATVVAGMQQRAQEQLAMLNSIALADAEISKESTHYIYRKDYNVGDLVTIIGDYNQTTTKRVTEFVESEDENGESGNPTLGDV
jgi:hypothetical protein